MSGLANINATATGQAPPADEAELYEVVPTSGGVPYPVVRETALSTAMLTRPIGRETRPATMDITTWRRPWRWWRAFTGNHGLIPDQDFNPDMTGGQETWRSFNPRTFRNMPTEPWDAGTEIGR